MSARRYTSNNFVSIDEVESLTSARAGAMAGTEPSDALRVCLTSFLLVPPNHNFVPGSERAVDAAGQAQAQKERASHVYQ